MLKVRAVLSMTPTLSLGLNNEVQSIHAEVLTHLFKPA